MSTTSEFREDSDSGNGTTMAFAFGNDSAVNTTTRPTNTTDDNNLTSTDHVMIISVVIQVVMFFVIIFGNSLVIHAVRRAKHLQTQTNYFIVQLAIADILVAAILPFHILLFLYHNLPNNIYLCQLRYFTVLATVLLSILCLLSMTYDRLLALLYPIHYQLKMTKKTFRIISAITWATAFGTGFIPMFWYNDLPNFDHKLCDYLVIVKLEYLQIVMIPGFFMVTFIIMGMYCKIFYIAHKNKERNDERRRRQQSITSASENVHHVKEKHAFTITKTCAIVMGTFFSCWLPYQVTVAIQIYTDNIHNDTLINLRTLFTFVAMSNSAMNPIIYAAR